MMVTAQAPPLLSELPGKNCGQCGFKTCAGLAEFMVHHPDAIKRCVFRATEVTHAMSATKLRAEDIIWKDLLDRSYDFILEPLPGDPGPRETIVPFNPSVIESLGVSTGSILIGRPAGVGCPVTHVGLVMEPPRTLDGMIDWCIVGPMLARERGVEIGAYHVIAYEGTVEHARKELQIGRRYFFLPRYCMLQSRHSGVISAAAKREDGMHVRVEGISIG
jgi:uncharacterized Fe-S cluster-containing protein